MYYLYILKFKNGLYYIGQTNNIARRIKDHLSDYGAKFTKDNGSFDLVYTETFNTRVESMKREKQIKKWSRNKKEALINGDLSNLINFSKNHQN